MPTAKKRACNWFQKFCGCFREPNRVIAIFTVALAIIGGVALWIARDTEKRQLRAYVIVKSARLAKDDSGHFKFGITSPDGRSELLIYYDIRVWTHNLIQ
jgi:hypothetical protein